MLLPLEGTLAWLQKAPNVVMGESPLPLGSLPGLIDIKCAFLGSSLPGLFTLPAASLRVLSNPWCTLPGRPATTSPTW